MEGVGFFFRRPILSSSRHNIVFSLIRRTVLGAGENCSRFRTKMFLGTGEMLKFLKKNCFMFKEVQRELFQVQEKKNHFMFMKKGIQI